MKLHGLDVGSRAQAVTQMRQDRRAVLLLHAFGAGKKKSEMRSAVVRTRKKWHEFNYSCAQPKWLKSRAKQQGMRNFQARP